MLAKASECKSSFAIIATSKLTICLFSVIILILDSWILSS